MATGRCEACGVEEYMPYVCKFCRGRYCASHRLPENHTCNGLGEYRERMRAEGRLMMPEGDVVRPQLSAGARLRSSFDDLLGRAEGRLTVYMLGAMVGVWFLGVVLALSGAYGVYDFLFVLDRGFWYKPWTLVTSVFAHAVVNRFGGIEFNHLFFNGLILFFFGPTIERLLGTRRFAYLFVGGGVLAGVLQLLVFALLLPAVGSSLGRPESGILGASGGIMALLGCLTILAPKMKVLLMFVIPVPLWAITTFYAVFDMLGVFNPGSGTAHVAHLAGLVAGLWYGKKLQAQGMRVQVGQPQGMNYGRSF